VAGSVVRIGKEPVSVETAVKRQSAIGLVTGHLAARKIRKMSSPLDGSRGETQLYIAITSIALVMIDVDEDFSIGNASPHFAEPVKARGVGGDDTIKFDALFGC
jgi:hypothetical protein